MIQVNTLIQQAHEDIGATGLEESTEGSESTVGLRKLNQLISELNSQGFISVSQNYIDVGPSTIYYFRQLTDEERETPEPNVIDMVPPEKIDGVGRRVGERFIQLGSADIEQMSTKNWNTVATGWNYGRKIEEIPGSDPVQSREYGILQLDGRCNQGARIFYSAKIPTYTLDDTVYLSDLYNSLLLSGLSYKLACFYHLDDQTKQDAYTDFTAAKNLIKRNNVTQRMLRTGKLGGSYSDQYHNALCPGQW